MCTHSIHNSIVDQSKLGAVSSTANTLARLSGRSEQRKEQRDETEEQRQVSAMRTSLNLSRKSGRSVRSTEARAQYGGRKTAPLGGKSKLPPRWLDANPADSPRSEVKYEFSLSLSLVYADFSLIRWSGRGAGSLFRL